MACFVIVHGAWGGGWEWAAVARHLRASGHDVFTPTLRGMGERSNDRGVIGLADHVADIVSVCEFEQLRDVVLCGASYGGMPVTGAADAIAERVRLLLYIDALAPRDGESALDLLPEPFADMVLTGLADHGDAWRMPIPEGLRDSLVPEGQLPADVRADYLGRLRDHPAQTFVEPIRLSGAVDGVRRGFIRCTTAEFAEELGGDPIEAGAQRARDEGWLYREIATAHDPQLFAPEPTAALLGEIATYA